MVWVEALFPFENGNLLSTIHQVGMVEKIVSNIYLCPLTNYGFGFPFHFKLADFILFII